jgi:hypothetical protein
MYPLADVVELSSQVENQDVKSFEFWSTLSIKICVTDIIVPLLYLKTPAPGSESVSVDEKLYFTPPP